jgi:sugar O-acyltransferase (sialic acid O-acetyltransferase NeuD family)
MNHIAIYGAGGCGRGVIPIVSENLDNTMNTRPMFIDDRLAGNYVNGYKVISFQDFCQFAEEECSVAIAIADPGVRRTIAKQCENQRRRFANVHSIHSVIMDDVKIGEGALISPFVTITSNVVIGKHFHANIYSYVEHDCTIGDYVTFAPRASCNGNVIIQDDVYVGAGAIIKQGQPGNPLIIGKGTIIGMGAVVTKSVPAGETVIGNPARPISR